MELALKSHLSHGIAARLLFFFAASTFAQSQAQATTKPTGVQRGFSLQKRA